MTSTRHIPTEPLGDKYELPELPSVKERDVEWAQTRHRGQRTKPLWWKDGLKFSLDQSDPDAYTFPHMHGFPQIRYVTRGIYIVNGKEYGPGTLIEFPAMTAYEVRIPEGGEWIVVQIPHPVTGAAPGSITGEEYGTGG
jgi:hypothetical protein